MQATTGPLTATPGSHTLIETVIPEKRFADTIAVDVWAPAEAIFTAFREVKRRAEAAGQ